MQRHGGLSPVTWFLLHVLISPGRLTQGRTAVGIRKLLQAPVMLRLTPLILGPTDLGHIPSLSLCRGARLQHQVQTFLKAFLLPARVASPPLYVGVVNVRLFLPNWLGREVAGQQYNRLASHSMSILTRAACSWLLCDGCTRTGLTCSCTGDCCLALARRSNRMW